MSPPKGEGLLFRDSVDVQPPDLETEETKASDANPYHKVLPPKFLACPKADPWAPVAVVEEEVVATTTKKKKDSKIQRAINSALEHPASTVLLMVMTFWSLFSDDIRVAALTKEVDVPFAIVTLVFMAIFLLETILRSWVALGFFLSFNFWLDLIATASMVLDFEVLWGECASVDTPCCLFRDAEVASEEEALAVLGSIQTATRIGRVLRLFRVVRVFRLIALIGKKQKEEEELKPSAVGKRYNELIVMKVVITVVLTLLVNQQLEPGELDLSIEFGLRMLTLGYNTSSFTGMVSDYEVRTLNMTFQELMVLNVEAATEYPAQKVQGGCYFDTTQAGGIHPVQGLYCCPERRATEIKQYIYNQTSMAAFDVKLVTRSGGLHNIVNTIFLALLLTTMFFLFSRDVTKMVVRPIESMIDIVRKLAENPSLTLAGQSKSKYETESVRVALAKIVGLMQLGFGGAGHEIIAANLANAEGQDLDLMVRGKKLDCAYGFCDIRQFTDTVECLQDQARARPRPPPAPAPLFSSPLPASPLCVPHPSRVPLAHTPPPPFRAGDALHQFGRHDRPPGVPRQPRRAKQEHRGRVPHRLAPQGRPSAHKNRRRRPHRCAAARPPAAAERPPLPPRPPLSSPTPNLTAPLPSPPPQPSAAACARSPRRTRCSSSPTSRRCTRSLGTASTVPSSASASTSAGRSRAPSARR